MMGEGEGWEVRRERKRERLAFGHETLHCLNRSRRHSIYFYAEIRPPIFCREDIYVKKNLAYENEPLLSSSVRIKKGSGRGEGVHVNVDSV